LQKLYEKVPDDKKDIAYDLIDNLSFIQIQLKILRGQILEYGMVSLYDNGKIKQDVVSPYSKTYNQLYPKYLQSIQTLNKLLPPNVTPPPYDALSAFTPTGR